MMFQKILVPLDGSSLAEVALPYVIRLAQAHGSELLFVRVVPQAVHPPPLYSAVDADVWLMRQTQQRQEVESYLDTITCRPEVAALNARRLVCESNNVADQLVEIIVQQSVDMVVLASRGRSGVARWLLGSVAQRVLERSPVPVMVVPAREIAAG
jgi:nucleotide-binding universal stress UspA family protein